MFKQDILLKEKSELSHSFVGTHVLAELYGAEAEKLNNVELISTAITEGVKQSGATLLKIIVERFNPLGCTLVAILSESHVSIHTYPEFGAAFVDAFTCGTSCKPEKIAMHLCNALGSQKIEWKTICRGQNDKNTNHAAI